MHNIFFCSVLFLIDASFYCSMMYLSLFFFIYNSIYHLSISIYLSYPTPIFFYVFLSISIIYLHIVRCCIYLYFITISFLSVSIYFSLYIIYLLFDDISISILYLFLYISISIYPSSKHCSIMYPSLFHIYSIAIYEYLSSIYLSIYLSIY